MTPRSSSRCFRHCSTFISSSPDDNSSTRGSSSTSEESEPSSAVASATKDKDAGESISRCFFCHASSEFRNFSKTAPFPPSKRSTPGCLVEVKRTGRLTPFSSMRFSWNLNTAPQRLSSDGPISPGQAFASLHLHPPLTF